MPSANNIFAVSANTIFILGPLALTIELIALLTEERQQGRSEVEHLQHGSWSHLETHACISGLVLNTVNEAAWVTLATNWPSSAVSGTCGGGTISAAWSFSDCCMTLSNRREFKLELLLSLKTRMKSLRQRTFTLCDKNKTSTILDCNNLQKWPR